MGSLGWVHMIFGLAALAAGTLVILLRKGTRWHRTLGHIYLTAMLALNGTSLFIYNLFGVFGPFHWMALASLITLAVGMTTVLMRRPHRQWLTLHGGCMAGSYVGLVAAAASEVTTRLPDNSAGVSAGTVAVTSTLIIGVGVWLIVRNLSQVVARAERRSRQRV